jgi:hypothetical protein
MPETKKELKEAFQSTQRTPGPRVIEIQRGVLTQMGFVPDKAIACLNTIQMVRAINNYHLFICALYIRYDDMFPPAAFLLFIALSVSFFTL